MSGLDLIVHGAPIVAALEAAGVAPEVVTDFDEVQEREARMGKNFAHPMLRIPRNDFVKREAFWLFLVKGNQTIAGMGAKYVDLTGESFESYLRRTSKGQYDRSIDPIVEVDPMLGLISGRLAYVGELKVIDEFQGNIKVLTRYARLMQLLCYCEWEFNYMYGFVTKEHIPLNRLYGFSMSIRDAIQWRDPVPEGRENSHALLASSRRQLDLLFRSE